MDGGVSRCLYCLVEYWVGEEIVTNGCDSGHVHTYILLLTTPRNTKYTKKMHMVPGKYNYKRNLQNIYVKSSALIFSPTYQRYGSTRIL